MHQCEQWDFGRRGHQSCIVACLCVLRQSSEFSSDAHSRRSATIHASPNLACPSAHLSLCAMLTHEQLVCPSVLIDRSEFLSTRVLETLVGRNQCSFVHLCRRFSSIQISVVLVVNAHRGET